MILPALLARCARLWPDLPAIAVVDGDAITYGALHRRVEAMAAALGRMGIAAGDRIAVVGQGSVDFALAVHGAVRMGAAAVPVDGRLPAAEIAGILDDAEPAVVVAEPGAYDRTVEAVRACTHAARVIAADQDDATFRSLFDGDAGIPPPLPTESAIALIVYTGGTTGRPKGVCLSHRALIWNGLTICHAQRLGHDDVYLAATPLAHAGSGTRLFTATVDGQTMVVARSFDAERFPSIVRQHGVTTTILVPTMMRRLLDGHPAESMSSLRSIVYGAAPAALPVIAEVAQRWSCDLYHAYGLSEASTNVALSGPEDHRAGILGSVGRELPGVVIEVRSGAGIAAVDEPGDVWVSSDKVMSGYWRRPEETAQTLVDGWLRTGDIGHRDGSGRLWLDGRSKEMIIVGGHNVFPAEVESVLAAHPDVDEVVVAGMHHDAMGEVPVALVVAPRAGDALCAELVRMAQSRLAAYKVPRTIHVVDVLPHTPVGKVSRPEVARLVASLSVAGRTA